MGAVKDDWMEHHGHVAMAAGYLVRRKLLRSCSVHGEVWGGGYDDLDGDFYRGAVGDWKKGADGPVAWASKLDVREFTDVLKEAYDEHCGDCCGYCAKNDRDD